MPPKDGEKMPDYSSLSLPITEKVNDSMMKLPSFPWASTELVDQYLLAFKKVIQHADKIAAHNGTLK